MDPQAPRKIAINHDDDCAQYVGTLPDGRQFFMTTPFVPVLETEGREFLALYLFDAAGDFLEARIPDSGFLVDDRLTLADIAMVQSFVNFGHVCAPIDAGKHPKVAAYIAAMHARPSIAPWIALERAALERRGGITK